MTISKPLATVDTPALLLDFDALRENINTMASFFETRRCRLRPPFKSHKCTRIARLQMEAGAVGMTCAKLGEAEVLADAGIREILIANEIVGPLKIERLIALCARANPIVAVDSPENIRMLSAQAVSAGVTLRVLVEVDIGMGRCGVPPGQPAVDLAGLVVSLPGLRFEGLQGYEGHCVDLRDAGERVSQSRAAIERLVNTRRQIERAGIAVRIVSGGGTGTYDINGNTDGIDEVQAGSYAAMDWWYTDIRPEFRQAMSILTTVVSRAKPRIAIIDVGRKGIGAEWGPPRLKNPDDGKVLSYTSEEHMTIELSGNREINVGDRLEIIPSHGCTTSNLYREFVVHRNGEVVDRWPIEGSGKLQ
jgi:D-serine deaminase-like pyridoxal phosphate-dependent protein